MRLAEGRDLASRYPEVAREAFGWDPTEVSAGTARKYEWLCPLGHRYSAAVSMRTSQGTGCPVCRGLRVLPGFNDLASRFPEIAIEAYGWDPSEVMFGSTQSRDWKCSLGHVYSAQVRKRTGRGQGCPYCSGQRTLAGFNDLGSVAPNVARQADGWDPAEVNAGSNKKMPWECAKHHRWAATVSSRVAGRGCPVCAGRKVEVGVNDLATVHPAIAAEAHGWDPRTVTPGSGTSQTWCCPQSHEYDAVVAKRVHGAGCPVCAGRRVLIGFNDLATTDGALALEAHGWDPTTVTGGSGQKRSWKCPQGHVYEAVVARRSGGSGCPVCAGQRVVAGFNDLATTDPSLAEQAVGWDPRTVTAGSNQVKAWSCVAGHQFNAMVGARSGRNGTGCPVCAGRRILPGVNDLATKFPQVADEARGWDPSRVSPGSHARVGWECPRGHEYEAVVASRTDNRNTGTGCPICAGRSVLVGFNDLATTHPFVASQASGWDPRTVTSGVDRPYAWRCEAGHEYSAAVHARTSRGSACPYCAGKKVLVGFNDLMTTHPMVAAEAYGWDPTEVVGGSARKKRWRCANGHLYLAAVVSRTRRGTGCAQCAGRVVEVGVNDLLTTFPSLATQAKGWDPSQVHAGSGTRRVWVCPRGHTYEASVKARTRRGHGCPYCSGRRVMDGFNDLATTHPDIAAEADGSDPRTVTRSNGTQRNWECSQGHRWWVTVDKRTHGHGCPFCSGHRVSVGFNDLATTHPEVAWQAVDFDPETVSAGSALRATWKCREGHTWTALVSTRTGQHGSGCPTCATYGYDPTRPGWLYLMERPGEQQIGITNVPEQRLRFHETRRWELLDIVGPASGVRIQRVERELKAWLRPNFGRIPGTHENWYVVEGTYVGTLDELLCRAALPSWGTSGLVVS